MKRAIKIAAAGMALAMCLATAGCGVGERRSYTVMLSEITSEPQYSSTVEMLEAIRPTVVDVTSYAESSASAGSGVIIGGAAEGEYADWQSASAANATYDQYFIITNHHVIEGGKAFEVDVLSIENGEESTKTYEATLVGGSFMRDIAVLSIRPEAGEKFACATFADSDKVKVGTEVFAIGNPLGILGGTVTHGIVSATKRAVAVGEIGSMTLMQTDTAINGGNSGGGLFDSAGRLVGIINSGYDTYNGQNVEGLNFAIPANDAKFAAKSLIETHEETGSQVTKYGEVTGDVRLDVSFTAATLYTDSTHSSTGNYLVASASGTESPLYVWWSNGYVAILSISVDGVKTSFTADVDSSYALTDLADEVLSTVTAGKRIEIEYRNVLSRTSGGGGMWGGLFGGTTYSYLDATTRTASFTAQQYVYEP